MEAEALPSRNDLALGLASGDKPCEMYGRARGAERMGKASTELARLNAADRDAFVDALGGIFEHAPWVAERAHAARPFATVADLHCALMEAVTGAGESEQTVFIRGHPELGGKVARAGAMTAESRQEQGSLGLDRLSEAEFSNFERLNGAYRARFGFPFIICARRHTRDSILANFERRLANIVEAERAAALAEIAHITRLRLVAAVEGPGKPKTDGRLSTHVLDTVSGRPAAGVKVVLKELGASAEGVLRETSTNADGRTDEPLIAGGPLRIGTYEIAFHIGAYFAMQGVAASQPPFLDLVPIRFAIAEPEGHYHVPLLASPWSYSTYRGS
jgi:2-oxo-4-hydroxy-4-carboxy-5-ureidoimidazoline decarboxylase